jgi:hypothetical protein
MNHSSVKHPLTRNRRRDVVENDQFDAFARRIVRAYARRVGNGDVEALAALVALTDTLDDAIHHAVHGLRDFGYSWAEIAARLGMTRQGAWQRWSTTNPDTPNGEQP